MRAWSCLGENDEEGPRTPFFCTYSRFRACKIRIGQLAEWPHCAGWLTEYDRAAPWPLAPHMQRRPRHQWSQESGYVFMHAASKVNKRGHREAISQPASTASRAAVVKMPSPAVLTLPLTRISRKSIGTQPAMDKENATVDVGSSLAASRKSRSKSMGPGGLDALKQSAGNRRAVRRLNEMSLVSADCDIVPCRSGQAPTVDSKTKHLLAPRDPAFEGWKQEARRRK